MAGVTRRTAAGALIAGLATGPALAATAGPRRVVSLNPCLDAILVQVADREQIAAVSHYTHEPSSTSSGALGLTFPFTHETAEEVVALRPDLVLTARHSSPATRAALARMGVRTELFGLPNTVEESLVQVMQVARAVNRPERGQALVARIRAALAEAAPPPGAPPLTAVTFQSGGFASARGTLMDEMMRRAGFENAATRYGLTRTGNIPLEKLIADPPDVLLAGQLEPGAPTWADRVLAHPALAHVAPRMHRAVFPQNLTFCGGPVLIESARMLARARREALAARAARS
ncbi:ABC transporter substrate-binding protein [Phenylobacterium aquaticum]|uniref:ABC transporter substrate-binding protein n=1 Tax=Phenylobacterium aquaticum TaxID=1763816 RepID=UPI001F5CB9C4|nr:ABC transporter substrate-binding protein [Phenylobacterium aquaticum]MCI3132469.1 ABC transporter substrate-binding protein [Phenylobacterium aquaticum]